MDGPTRAWAKHRPTACSSRATAAKYASPVERTDGSRLPELRDYRSLVDICGKSVRRSQPWADTRRRHPIDRNRRRAIRRDRSRLSCPQKCMTSHPRQFTVHSGELRWGASEERGEEGNHHRVTSHDEASTDAPDHRARDQYSMTHARRHCQWAGRRRRSETTSDPVLDRIGPIQDGIANRSSAFTATHLHLLGRAREPKRRVLNAPADEPLVPFEQATVRRIRYPTMLPGFRHSRDLRRWHESCFTQPEVGESTPTRSAGSGASPFLLTSLATTR
jgi:hypothetical protein